MKKGRGQIIHVSDFVEEENGHLIIRNQDGVVMKDARCITYPGAVVMYGGIMHSSSHKLTMQFQSLRRRTQTVLHFLSLISHLLMHHLDQMHFVHLT